MKTYTVVRKPDGADWNRVSALEIDSLLWTKPPLDVSARAQVCWDEEGFAVRLSATEADIRAEHHTPTGMPCEDSCLEFFFCPQAGDTRYFNIEFNPNCCMFLGLTNGREMIMRLLPEKDWFRPVAERTADGWRVTYSVPFAFVRHFFPTFAPKRGDRFRANFYKCGDLTKKEHYLAWSPTKSETPEFHLPRDFGEIVLA